MSTQNVAAFSSVNTAPKSSLSASRETTQQDSDPKQADALVSGGPLVTLPTVAVIERRLKALAPPMASPTLAKNLGVYADRTLPAATVGRLFGDALKKLPENNPARTIAMAQRENLLNVIVGNSAEKRTAAKGGLEKALASADATDIVAEARASAQQRLARETKEFLGTGPSIAPNVRSQLEAASRGEGLNEFLAVATATGVPFAVAAAWLDRISYDSGVLDDIAGQIFARQDDSVLPGLAQAFARTAGDDAQKWIDFVSLSDGFANLVIGQEATWLKAFEGNPGALKQMLALYRLRGADVKPSTELLKVAIKTMTGDRAAVIGLASNDVLVRDAEEKSVREPEFTAVVNALREDKVGLLLLSNVLRRSGIRRPLNLWVALGVAVRGDAASVDVALGIKNADGPSFDDSTTKEIDCFIQALGSDKACLLAVANTFLSQERAFPDTLTGRLQEVLRGDTAALRSIFSRYLAGGNRTEEDQFPAKLLQMLAAGLRGQTAALRALSTEYRSAGKAIPDALSAAIDESVRGDQLKLPVFDRNESEALIKNNPEFVVSVERIADAGNKANLEELLTKRNEATMKATRGTLVLRTVPRLIADVLRQSKAGPSFSALVKLTELSDFTVAKAAREALVRKGIIDIAKFVASVAVGGPSYDALIELSNSADSELAEAARSALATTCIPGFFKTVRNYPDDRNTRRALEQLATNEDPQVQKAAQSALQKLG